MKKIIGKIDPNIKTVTIIGAGFSGLVLGHYLKREGFKVSIFERSSKVGGKIQTKKTTGGPIERGPNALFLNADGVELLKDLDLTPLPATKKLKRLLWINGKPKRALQPGALGKLALNAHRKPPLLSDGLTVAEFFRPLLGQENVDHYLSPILSGVYATSSDHLHFKSIFNEAGKSASYDSYWAFFKQMMKLKKLEPKHDPSGSVSFEGGLQVLTSRLAEGLKKEIKTDAKDLPALTGNVVICTDAPSAAEILEKSHPQMSEELRRLHYQELSSVTVFLKHEIRSLQSAFGVLIPTDAGLHSIGVINNKAIFPSNYENTLSYTFISPKKLTLELVHEDLKLLDPAFTPEDIELFELSHWEKGLPVYDLQRHLGIKRLHQLAAATPTLAIFGNYVAGISLREMISAAKDFAQGRD